MLDKKLVAKAKRNQTSILSQITEQGDLMSKAIQLQAKAAEFGFDWATIEPIFGKLQEEIGELKDEVLQLNSQANVDRDYLQQRLQDELGDVLFCCMNLARFLKVDPAKALKSTNQKFERRFSFIESFVAEEGKSMEDLSLEELDQIWDKAKAKGL